MATSEQTPEQRELSLIGKVELRIALADSDSKLEATLKTYLTPLLLKLASDHLSVRNKVISVCQHISTRTKPQSIQLPVAALIKQFRDQESSLIRHFDLAYIQQGVSRLNSTEKAALLPVIVTGISKSGKHGSIIFNLFLRLLEAFTLPPRGSNEDLNLKSALEATEEDTRFLTSWIGKLLLFNIQKGGTSSSPGLSPVDYHFLNVEGKEGAWDSTSGGLNLLRTKILASKFVASGLFSDRERFLPALLASADSASTLSDIGDDMMKRSLPATDLEDEALIANLFRLYFGHEQMPRVKIPLRVKILGLLGKSTISTSFGTQISKVVDDGITSVPTDGGDVIMHNTPTPQTANREILKLRTAVFTYINFVARYGKQDTLLAIAPGVVSRLRDFIEHQGWPKPGINEDLVSRAYAYEVVGILVKTGPRDLLVEATQPTLDILRWMFDSLAKDSSGNSIVVSIEESISTILGAASRLTFTPVEESAIESILLDQMILSSDLPANNRIRSTKYAAIRFANRCLPYSSTKARLIDALGMGAANDRVDVREESERGLSPYWYQNINGSTMSSEQTSMEIPTFDHLVDEFFPGRSTSEDDEPFAIVKATRLKYPLSFSHMVIYIRRVLVHHASEKAGIHIDINSSWERQMDSAIERDVRSRVATQDLIHHLLTISRRQLRILISAMFVNLTEQNAVAGEQFINVFGLCPEPLLQKLAVNVEDLLPLIFGNDHARRMAGARTFGILASQIAKDTPDKQEQLLQQLVQTSTSWEAAIGAAANRVHGSLIALGFYYSRAAQRKCDIRSQGFDGFLATLTAIVTTSKNSNLQEAAALSLGQLAMFRTFSKTQLVDHASLKAIIDSLFAIAKGGNETAVLSLGKLAMTLPDDDDLSHLIEQMHRLHEIRQAELHFTIGEAFSYIIAGWSSTALATELDVPGALPTDIERDTVSNRILDRILSDCATTKPALKKAAVMWLMCLVQFCGGQEFMQQRLARCQMAFKRCLSDRDELVQESASRGLGLVYENGNKSLRDDLVRDLVASFSSDQQSALSGNVSADTQLFEPGALPTGDGSVSTYKDIMSLASEVGDSSLVYRFMSMASSNAIWSSRAAFGRFGLSNVLSASSVDGYLAENPKLYPKLFRYRFDPHGGVQRSMNEIWNALVKDSSATIDKYFDAIMDDLLVAILGKEWRTRQASCAAIADLVQGRSLEKYGKYLERIWTQCFKVLDDIKESVRAAASSLARVLTGVLTRALEADHSANNSATMMLKHVLPFLLSGSGMESSAEEVRMFAVHTLLQIIKKSNGKTLRPFIPELVERLIGSLSSLEPEAVNYVHLNAAKYNLTEQKIDDMRLSSVRSSPLMEAIERCLDLTDEDTMQQLQPKLESAMKSAVGLPSKVGSSRVLVSLATRRLQIFRPFADSFLRLIEKVILDRNETVASSYAAAAGYVARAATDKQLLRILAFAQKLYFDEEGGRSGSTPRRAITAGELVYAMSKHASDRFNSLASAVLPFVFIAKHDDDEHVKEQFQNTWDEAVGGSRAVMLYLDEIMTLCLNHLDSAQWHLKHSAARSVAESVVAAAAVESELSPRIASALWTALEKALAGKTWDGKEVVLDAFVKFTETARSWYQEQNAVAESILKIAIREAKRQNQNYRPHAVKALGKVSLARSDIDMYDSVRAISEKIVDECLVERSPKGDDAMDIDTSSKADEINQSTLSNVVEALLNSINPGATNDSALDEHMLESFKILRKIQPVSAPTLKARYVAITALFKRCKEITRTPTLNSDAANHMAQMIFEPVLDTESLRLLRADAIVAATDAFPLLKPVFRPNTLALLETETFRTVRDRLASTT